MAPSHSFAPVSSKFKTVFAAGKVIKEPLRGPTTPSDSRISTYGGSLVSGQSTGEIRALARRQAAAQKEEASIELLHWRSYIQVRYTVEQQQHSLGCTVHKLACSSVLAKRESHALSFPPLPRAAKADRQGHSILREWLLQCCGPARVCSQCILGAHCSAFKVLCVVLLCVVTLRYSILSAAVLVGAGSRRKDLCGHHIGAAAGALWAAAASAA
jgi:hypothetical protein